MDGTTTTISRRRRRDKGEGGRMKALEFYSGIGGWSEALELAMRQLGRGKEDVQVSASFEINLMANDVYAAQVKDPPRPRPTARLIESLTVNDLEKQAVALWMLSPPCQPYTRNNKTEKRDKADSRSASFLHLCALLQSMASPPGYIALENVEGFETSECCALFLSVLRDRGYEVWHGVLSPALFRWPNERPRYYALARRGRGREGGREGGRPGGDGGGGGGGGGGEGGRRSPAAGAEEEGTLRVFPPVWRGKTLPPFLASASSSSTSPVLPPFSLKEEGEEAVEGEGEGETRQIREYLEHDRGREGLWSTYAVPPSLLAKPSAWCFDIVSPTSRRSSCFTKSYFKFIRGTGSILYDKTRGKKGEEEEEILIQDPSKRRFEEDMGWQSRFAGALRYFTPMEVARLMHFPSSFAFPAHVSDKKCYELLGNSLHVGVATELLVWLLREDERDGGMEGWRAVEG
ncbi:hypothetical protein VYU27_006914 [Nannochloropsis oceanica]